MMNTTILIVSYFIIGFLLAVIASVLAHANHDYDKLGLVPLLIFVWPIAILIFGSFWLVDTLGYWLTEYLGLERRLK